MGGPGRQEASSQEQEEGGKHAADSEMALSEIAGYPPHEYADDDGDAHGNEAHGQRDPRPLKHPGKDVASQIIGSEQV